MKRIPVVGIYKITSPIGKVYIGASKNIYERWDTYSENVKLKMPRIRDSFNQFGKKNHKFEIIEECQLIELKDKERYWQDYYNVLEEGLNSILTKTKTKKGVYCKELKEQLEKTNPSLIQSTRTIQKFDFNHNLLAEYHNTISAALENNIDDPLYIYRWVTGKSKDKNFVWKYKDETEKEKFQREIYAKRKAQLKIIYQYDLNGNFIKEWRGHRNPANFYKVHRDSIGAVLRGKRNSCAGYFWTHEKKH